PDFDLGLRELERVVKQGRPMIIVDNYGSDEFTSYSPHNISSSVDTWIERGFDYEVIHTEFVFDNVDEAQRLLGFYFGECGRRINQSRIEYKVVVYTKIKSSE